MLSSVTIDYADNGGDDDEIDSKIANKMCFFFHSKNKVFRTIIGRQLSLRKTVQRGKLSVKKTRKCSSTRACSRKSHARAALCRSTRQHKRAVVQLTVLYYGRLSQSELDTIVLTKDT